MRFIGLIVVFHGWELVYCRRRAAVTAPPRPARTPGECEWTVTYAVSSIPTVLGAGPARSRAMTDSSACSSARTVRRGLPQERTWRMCADTVTLWRGDSARSYTRTRDGTVEHCEE